MKKWLWIAVLPLFIIACKSKKKAPAEDEGISSAEFIALFEDIKLPYTLADDSLGRKKQDTSSISYKTFIQLVPDTLLAKQFGKAGKPRIFPIGKNMVKKAETYLLLKAIGPTQKAAYVVVFDKDKKFVTGLPVLVEDNSSATSQTTAIDNKFSITNNTQRTAPDGRQLYKRATYAFISSVESFALIQTESNETEAKQELLNPIDTLAAKNKLSGNYLQNRSNLVSIRDSKKPNEFLFFIHFEKDNGTCKGELKGNAKITAPGKAAYRQPGDQCILEFSFKGNTVSIKEDGCGSHRDIKCFFEGSFVRKSPAKPAKPAKKK